MWLIRLDAGYSSRDPLWRQKGPVLMLSSACIFFADTFCTPFDDGENLKTYWLIETCRELEPRQFQGLSSASAGNSSELYLLMAWAPGSMGAKDFSL